MDLKLKNRVAFVGGSSKGLGKACALRLAAEGANVVICGRTSSTLELAAKEIRHAADVQVLPVQADLSKGEEARRAVEMSLKVFGRIDVLVANSGGPPPGTFFQLSQGDWDAGYQSTLYYIIGLYRSVIPQMKSRKWGRIINILSLTVKEPSETLLLSSVFRAGVASLAKSISKELIRDNITINNVCPGSFKTDRAVSLMTAQALKSGKTIEEIERESASSLPLGKFQSPDELGNAIAFFASELSQGITGTTLQIDGGAYRGFF